MSDAPLGRRDFFRRSLASLRETLAEVVTDQMARLEEIVSPPPPEGPPPAPEPPRRLVVRPPGAIAEPEFLATCERCRKCVDACHLFCIIPAQPGMAAPLGTPYLLPEQAPCDFCHACAEVCPSGAIRAFDPAHVKIGTAVVEELHCLRTNGEPCDKCWQACPRQDLAIQIVPDQTLPVIHALYCTGCGFCGQACPAPARAITIFPE